MMGHGLGMLMLDSKPVHSVFFKFISFDLKILTFKHAVLFYHDCKLRDHQIIDLATSLYMG